MTHATHAHLPPPAPWRGLAVATALALALHAALLLGWPNLNLPTRAGTDLGTLSTRLIPAAPAPAAQPEPETAPQPQPEPPDPTPQPTQAAPKPTPKTAPKPPSQSRPRPKPAAPASTAPRGSADGAQTAIASLLQPYSGATAGGGREPYAPQALDTSEAETRQLLHIALQGQTHPAAVPRGATLRYQVQGTLAGQQLAPTQSILAWRRTDTVYEAEWNSTAIALRGWHMAAAGLIADNRVLLPLDARLTGPHTGTPAPGERMHFDHAAGALHLPASEQAPAHTTDLRPGTQDLLSAAIQLGAWLAGDASRLQPGQTFTLHMTDGAAPRLGRWFVEPGEDIAVPGSAQPISSVHLSHMPTGDAPAQSPRVELWLAPALDYLPARLRMSWPGGDALEHQLINARLHARVERPANPGKPRPRVRTQAPATTDATTSGNPAQPSPDTATPAPAEATQAPEAPPAADAAPPTP